MKNISKYLAYLIIVSAGAAAGLIISAVALTFSPLLALILAATDFEEKEL